MSTIMIDPADLQSLIDLMDEHGNTNSRFPGTNELGEDTMVSITSEKIVVETNQTNGWVRKNVYWRDGTYEELYDGRWA